MYTYAYVRLKTVFVQCRFLIGRKCMTHKNTLFYRLHKTRSLLYLTLHNCIAVCMSPRVIPRFSYLLDADWPDEFVQNSKYQDTPQWTSPYHIRYTDKYWVQNLLSPTCTRSDIEQTISKSSFRTHHPYTTGLKRIWSENWDTVISIVNKDIVVINKH